MMFSGKGGVGKTTCAAATALHYASQGERTLAISTDATPSLSHIFEAPGDEKPKMVRESLYAFALIESVHLVALSVLGGAVLMVDLRMLGIGLTEQGIDALATSWIESSSRISSCESARRAWGKLF